MSQCGQWNLLCKWKEGREEVSNNLMDEIPDRIESMNQFYIPVIAITGLGLVYLLTR